MFRKTKTCHQLNLYTNSYNQFSGRALKIYNDDKEWHNQFREEILELIDEDIFRPLFADDFGSPNSSIRVLVSMIILKDAHGLSDSQLHNNCLFHAQFRSALGLHNNDDPIPVPATYYNFRKRIVDWERSGNDNLLERVFKQVTKSQFIYYKVSGKKARMDIKLIGSNIAKLSRYELVHEALRMVYKSSKLKISKLLSKDDLVFLKDLFSQSCFNITYHSSDSEIDTKLQQLGIVIYKILKHFPGKLTEQLQTLQEIFWQQFEVIEDAVSVLPKEKLLPGRVDSPHDPDCRFRKKGKQSLSGYYINVTETCDPDNDLNLITSVIVEPANVPDQDFFQPACEATEEVTNQKIETNSSDGAYYCQDNFNYCVDNEIDHIMSGISSSVSGFDISVNDDGTLLVVDTLTDEVIPSKIVKTKSVDAEPKWSICVGGKKKYFTQKSVDACQAAKLAATRSKEELNLRNNVEATIFQLGYHYRGNKTRYRGIIKHKLWAFARCIWINFRRIMKYMGSIRPDCVQNMIKCADSAQFFVFNSIIAFLLLFEIQNLQTQRKMFEMG
ncbi:MAG: transposase [Oscillospiraceae bacterium]|jgi:hypothetical protein|nr:transposase [Oscillospiraceae bacterium]